MAASAGRRCNATTTARASARLSRAGRGRATRLLLAAGLAWIALGASVANAGCGGYTCAVKVTQPSLPGWLTIADGSSFLANQSITGVAADEYGSTPTADPTLYSGASGYPTAPSFAGQQVIDTVLANLNGSGPGDTDAVVLSQDSGGSDHLAILGPQSSGYQQVASVTVPIPNGAPALGVIAGPAPDSPERGAVGQIVVVTHAGYVVYQWQPTSGSPGVGTLSLQHGGSPQSDLPTLGGGTVGIDPSKILSVYQAPPGENGYTTPCFGTSCPNPTLGTFAIAYDSSDFSGSSYTVEVLGYGTDNTISGGFLNVGYQDIESFGPVPTSSTPTASTVEARYAITPAAGNDAYIHVATVTGGGPPKMTSFDKVVHSAGGTDTAATPVWTSPSGTTTTQNCPTPASGLPQLSVDATAAPSVSPGLGAGASVCAALTSNLATPVQFEVERTALTEDGTFTSGGSADQLIGQSSDSPADLAVPAGVKQIAVQLGFPCDEVLGQFVANPVTSPVDGSVFPAINAGDANSYCQNGLAAGGQSTIFNQSHDSEFNPGSSLAVNIEEVAVDGSGNASLNLTSVSYPMQADAGSPETDCFSVDLFDFATTPGEPSCAGNDQALTDTTTQVAKLPGTVDAGHPAQLAMIPIDPGGFVQSENLVTDGGGNVIKDPFTRNPMPVALLAAPPYYAGGQQQVTATSMTLDKNQCTSVTNQQSNMVGAEAGEDAEIDDLFSKAFEEELLFHVEASWTSSISHESCNSFSQQFIGGNFGNNFTHDNSLVFSVQTGTITYGNVVESSLGVGLTPNCSAAVLGTCSQIFDPSGVSYALQTLPQLENPPPNDFYAADDRQLNAQYGASLRAHLPSVGNPSSYPSDGTSAAGATPPTGGANGCTGTPSGAGSGDAGITLANPFVAPTVTPPATDLLAGAPSEVNPAVGANEAGTTSTIGFNSTTDQSSSTEFSVGASYGVTAGGVHLGVSYQHGWGLEDSQSLTNGTSFEGGVNDFQGYFNPYQYQMYECKVALGVTPGAGPAGASTPAFLAGYMATETGSSLPLNMAAPNLPSDTVGRTYAGAVYATGGQPPYTYTVTSGALPDGLTLDPATGQVSGTPTTAGTASFTVTVTDTIGTQAQQDESLTVNPPLADQNPLPGGNVGTPYSQPIIVTGGNGTYTYLLASGNVPPGLTFNNSSGVLAGTPTKTGTYCFTIYVTDTETPAATANLQSCVTIGDVIAITTASLPKAINGNPYSTQIAATGGDAAAYAFSAFGTVGPGCDEEQVPPGLGLDPSSGAITGVPSAAGNYCFTVFLTDGSGGTAQQFYKLTVLDAGTAAAPQITSGATTTFVSGSTDTFTVTTSGGPAPVVSESGALPPGVSLTDNGDGTATLAGTVPSGSEGTYPLTLHATNGVSPDAAQPFTLTVDAGPAITQQPADQTTTPGTGVTFTAAAGGVPAPSGTWEVSRDGGATWALVNLFGPGANGNFVASGGSGAITVTPLDLSADQLEFREAFINDVGTARTDAATLTVDYPPGITQEPSSETITAGDDAAFSAAANGEPAPGAQWQVSSDGGTTWTNISGATSSTLALHHVPASDDGDQYRAVFTNSEGSAATSVVALTVDTRPAITTQPTDDTTVAGGMATFSAAASGSPAPSVQWQESSDGGATWTSVTGGTSPTLTLSNVAAGEDGHRYRAVFMNPAGSATSAAAVLTVQTAPAMTAQPTDATAIAGSTTTFTAAASGSPAPTVQWEVSTDDGATWAALFGATSPTLTLTGVGGGADGHRYEAVFTNPAGTVTSSAATLTVQTPPTITTQPSGQTVVAGAGTTLTAAAGGKPAPSVQWQQSTDGGASWADVPGATTPSLALTNVPAGANGEEYQAVFSNPAGKATTTPATLTVETAPVVTAQPPDQSTSTGRDASFTAAASGKPAAGAQWQTSTDGGTTWTDVVGATRPTLALVGIPAKDSGNRYRAIFTNPAGVVTTRAATLTVDSAPAVAGPPAPATVAPGGSVTFITEVSGTPAPSITWEVSGDGGRTWTTIIGATSSTLTLVDVSPGQNGYLYRAVITNSQGTTTTAPAMLSVTAAPASPLLACTNRPVQLIDVVRRRGRVSITGVARSTLVGRRVTIRLLATHKTVATATIGTDGSFATTVPLPPKRVRFTNLARYQAFAGGGSSDAVKFARRMHLTTARQVGKRVQLAGFVTGAFPKGSRVVITERTSCAVTRVVATATLRTHNWSASVPAPTGLASSVAVFQAKATVFAFSRPLRGRHPTIRTFSLLSPVRR